LNQNENNAAFSLPAQETSNGYIVVVKIMKELVRTKKCVRFQLSKKFSKDCDYRYRLLGGHVYEPQKIMRNESIEYFADISFGRHFFLHVRINWLLIFSRLRGVPVYYTISNTDFSD
jgi:hypothetical protein